MRRKQREPASLAPGLGPEALRPAPIDDSSLTARKRAVAFRAWLAERDAWVARREAHSEQYGWPGGDIARWEEEDSHHPIPDAPFDPDDI
jgi:hypothetical protein